MPSTSSTSPLQQQIEIIQHLRDCIAKPAENNLNPLGLCLHQAKAQGLSQLDLSDQMISQNYGGRERKDRASLKVCRVLATELLSNNPQLTHLSFRNCYLGREARVLILQALQQGATNLQELDFKLPSFPKRMGLSNREFNALSGVLNSCKKLEVLKLETQPLPIKEQLVPLLKNAPALRNVELGDQQVNLSENHPLVEESLDPLAEFASAQDEDSAIMFEIDDLDIDEILSQTQYSSESSLTTIASLAEKAQSEPTSSPVKSPDDRERSQYLSASSLPSMASIPERTTEELAAETDIDPLNLLSEAHDAFMHDSTPTPDPQMEVELDALTCYDELQNNRQYQANRGAYFY